VLLAIALVFVWRSFYAMRIPKEEPTSKGGAGFADGRKEPAPGVVGSGH